MPDPRLTLVVAVADNGAIGFEGRMPWRLSTDLKRFRDLTWGRPLTMGRRTFASIGRPLPGRETVVVTRDRDFHAEGVHVVHDFAAARTLAGDLARAAGVDEVIVAGGAEIYALALPLARRILLTEVHARPRADTFLPPFGSEWQETAREEIPASEKDDVATSFVTLERACG